MMKTRPLCFACLFFFVFQVMFLTVVSGKSIGDIPASSIFYDEKEKSVSLSGQVYKKTTTSNIQILYLKNTSTKDSHLLIYDENFIEIAIGQVITLQGTTSVFERARNPGNFDQRLYYAKQHLYGMVWCDQLLSISGEEQWLMEKLYQVKQQWKNRIVEGLGEKKGAVLTAMLLGERSDMEPEMKELYQKNGIGHILAISGLHISFIGLGVYKLIRKTGLDYIPSGLLAIGVLSLYVMMIGFSVSVIRAFVMLLFRVGADMSGRVYDMVTALSVAAAITVGSQPLYLADAGFLLSHGAILGILFVLPALEKLFPCRLKLFSGCYASVAIQIMLFPILLWFYYEIPIYSVLLNVLVIPLMSVVLGAGMFGSLVGFVIWPVGKFCLQICGLVLSFFEMLSRAASRLPYATIVLGQPKLWKVMIYYFTLVIFVVVVLNHNKKKTLQRLQICACMVSCILFTLMAYRGGGHLRITMLDVGQGDSIFLRGPKGKTYLIDGGSSDVDELGKYRMEPFLKSQGVGVLDYVFLTHGDTDHYSGVLEMLGRQDVGVRIRHLVLPENWIGDDALVKLVQVARQQGVVVAEMHAGQCLQEGEFEIQCIQPGKTDSFLNGNAGSLVLGVRFGRFSMLLTGDVEGKGEEFLTDRIKGQKFDILKVAHHGSKNSTSDLFLKTIRPKIALISSGANNSYGHPHKETIARLRDRGCKIFETAKNGAITFRTNGNSLTFHCFLY